MSTRRELPEEDRVYIREAAEQLDRRIGTLRKWEATGVLPMHLRPKRGKRKWRYWTPRQIEGIQAWLKKTDRRPGKALPHLADRVDPKLVQDQIRAMRKPRGKRSSQRSKTDDTGSTSSAK